MDISISTIVTTSIVGSFLLLLLNRQELEAIEHFIQKKKEEMKDGE